MEYALNALKFKIHFKNRRQIAEFQILSSVLTKFPQVTAISHLTPHPLTNPFVYYNPVVG